MEAAEADSHAGKIAGIALGSTILRQICPSLAPKGGHLDQRGLHVTNAGPRVDGYEYEGEQNDDEHSSRESQSKGNNDYWDERRNRHG